MPKTLGTVTSQDGTRIAFERLGDGPPLIVVDGAFCTREMGPSKKLAPLLADRFTVYAYDRRGRGDSGDTLPFEVTREVEDLAALIEQAGGTASVLGTSSGASLALEAARQGLPIDRLVLFEAPMVVDDSRPPVGEDYEARLEALIDSGQRGKAIKLFMREGIRVPAPFVALMPLMPAWSRLKAVAHTVVYDTRIVGDQLHGRPLRRDHWRSVEAPVLVLAGGKSPVWMQNAMRALADALPHAEHRTLAGQTHMVKAQVLAPVAAEFLAATTRAAA